MLLLKSKEGVVTIIWLVPLLLSFLLINENILRASVLIVSLLIWYIFFLKSENKSVNTILFLLFISAFNITLTLGDLDSCYKNGVFVNYLCPTLHILDIFLILSLVVNILYSSSFNIIKNIFISLPVILYSTIHILLHPNINTAISISRLLIFILLLIFIDGGIKEKIKERTTMIVLVSSLLVQLSISVLQFLSRRDLGLQFLGESNLLAGTINSSFISFPFGEYLRSYGTFPHPNVLAGFALSLSFFSWKIFGLKNWKTWLISFLSFVLILLTLSRLHILIFVLFVLALLVIELKNHFFSFFPILWERFNSLGGNSVSVKERLTLLKESLNILKENWFVGVGGGEFVRYLENGVRTSSNISLFQPVHNIFMLLLTEQGFLGAILFPVYILYSIFKQNKELLTKVLIILILLIIGMFDHYLVSLPQGLIMILIMTL